MKTHRMNIAVSNELYEELLWLDREGIGFNWSKVAGEALRREVVRIRAEYERGLLETEMEEPKE